LHQVCLHLGSNIEPEQNLPQAINLLEEKLPILQHSSVWESASVDCCYPNYLNMALVVSTQMDAKELKEKLLRPLEAHMGRVRTEDKNASRQIDVDIILFDGELQDPSLWQHAHLAIPVAEIFPELRSETGETLKKIAMRLAQSTPINSRKDIHILLPKQD
jgi:2-amino-4-hydroxy-6-hydroxymethyldihydropteridine diphosphokinase